MILDELRFNKISNRMTQLHIKTKIILMLPPLINFSNHLMLEQCLPDGGLIITPNERLND